MPAVRLGVPTKLISFLFAAVLLTTGFFLNLVDIETGSGKNFDLSFIPSESFEGCEQLFANTSAARFSLSLNYLMRHRPFEDAIAKATYGFLIEGLQSRQVREQYLVLHYLARQTVASTVCETGFNMGNSAFYYLTASSRIVVNSFGLGRRPYAYVLAEYLRNLFPTRFNVHFGNSMQTIPNFIRANPGFRCDLIFVDGGGGHVVYPYPVAMSDLRNLARMANLDGGNVIVLNGYPTDWGVDLGLAWDEMTGRGFIEELMRCQFTDSKGERGFVMGRVVKRPTKMKLTIGNDYRRLD